jgi:integrator complex subunit 1
MARLVHESSWGTLHQTVASLLEGESCLDDGINSSAVLDFFWACLHKPVLWQGCVGREAIENSHLSLGIDESELSLTPSQLKCLLDCILREAYQWTLARADREDTLLYSRLPLLVSCYKSNRDGLETVVHHLTGHQRFPTLAQELLVQLYHIDERVFLFADRNNLLNTLLSSPPSIPCKLDTELHHLVAAMCDAKPGQDGMHKMTSAAMICRKIAYRHPTLFLRQLPHLGWLLRGRAHLNHSEFRNRNHKHVFQNSLFLLHLLQPLVFEDSQSQALETCLQPFFEFLQNQCRESKKHQSMVLRFSELLVLYAQHNRTVAAPLIYRHLGLLQSLSDIYITKKSSLRALVDCFPMDPLMEEGEEGGQGFSSGPPLGVQIMVAPPSVASHSLTHEQVMPFLKKLEQGQLREDVLKVLQDLEETSLHSVEILKHFVPELCRLIQDPEPTSCALAHSLLLRHVKETPSAVEGLLSIYMSCLESHDHSVVMAAVGVVPELVLLCPSREASRLLQKLFRLATHSFMNCTPQLLRAVEACTTHVFQ